MKPKLLHQEAMALSFKAKLALAENRFDEASKLFEEAAKLESQVAKFYLDKPELEPTRSIITRSAAYLNLKAGLVEQAKEFIFFGLMNFVDEQIKNELETALEIAVSFKDYSKENASRDYHYLIRLRQQSIHYVIEPATYEFGHSVSFEMIRDFADSYLKSLRAYCISKIQKLQSFKGFDDIPKIVDKIINPLVTNTAFGSFKFSIANDVLYRDNEDKEIFSFKKNIISNYHEEIIANPLSDADISLIKQQYNDKEVDQIFRPLMKIKSANSRYKVGYYSIEDLKKKYVSKVSNAQKIQLLTTPPLTKDDIGELESIIMHKRNSTGGKVSKITILKEKFKHFETEIRINQIEPKEYNPIILTDDILINMEFDSTKGFTFSFEDLKIEHSDVTYADALVGFHNALYEKIVEVASINEKSYTHQNELGIIKRLIGNLNALKK